MKQHVNCGQCGQPFHNQRKCHGEILTSQERIPDPYFDYKEKDCECTEEESDDEEDDDDQKQDDYREEVDGEEDDTDQKQDD